MRTHNRGESRTRQIQALEATYNDLIDELAKIRKERFGIRTSIKLLEMEFLDDETVDASEMEILNIEINQLYDELILVEMHIIEIEHKIENAEYQLKKI